MELITGVVNKLIADENKILVRKSDDKVVGTKIYLAISDSQDNYYEIDNIVETLSDGDNSREKIELESTKQRLLDDINHKFDSIINSTIIQYETNDGNKVIINMSYNNQALLYSKVALNRLTNEKISVIDINGNLINVNYIDAIGIIDNINKKMLEIENEKSSLINKITNAETLDELNKINFMD